MRHQKYQNVVRKEPYLFEHDKKTIYLFSVDKAHVQRTRVQTDSVNKHYKKYLTQLIDDE